MANYLIIAASSRMGQATSSLLEAQGHTLYKTARNQDKIQPDAILEASDFHAMDQVFQQAQEALGQLDGVVNFAGDLLLKPAHFTTQEQYHGMIQSSLTTAFATVQSAGKHLKHGGSVVLIAAAVALTGFPNYEAMAAAKAGVIGLTRSAAATYAHNKLRFNAISPGLVETELTQQITSEPVALNYSLKLHPLGRIGTPEDIARAVAFFLDPKNDWITGQVLNVDGGLAHLKTLVD
jgi:NAD(P)-dependent dehydrogenase (short-subunit alcohol dehydrogenase family)